MRTEKQIQASRENGRKSRGPVTPEGKAKSSRNSLKHGFFSHDLHWCPDCQERYLRARASYIQTLNPANPKEEALIETAAISRARSHWAMHESTHILMTAGQDYRFVTSAKFEMLHRLEMRFLRQRDKALAEIRRLRREARRTAQTELPKTSERTQEHAAQTELPKTDERTQARACAASPGHLDPSLHDAPCS